MIELTRRVALQAGGLALTGAGALLSGLSRAATAAPVRAGKARSVIMIFNSGAPSHTDLWDMKPETSADIRGDFRPIDTNVSGVQISELLPGLARHADKLAILRTLHHRHSGHNSGMHWSIVGRPYRIDSTLINPSRADIPSFGTLTGWLAQRDGYSGALPPYVITPGPHCDSKVYLTPGQYGGCLGSRYDPFVLNSDPNAKDFAVPDLGMADGMTTGRVAERLELLGQLNKRSVSTESARELSVHQSRAASLMTSRDAGRAFDLTEEPDSVRDRYGRHKWGQSHLLARRLVEAGVPFISTVNGESIIWDTHKDNTNRLKNSLVPPMERAYVALLEDLSERGLLDSTLVVWMGDFGRTPKITSEGGRDHWPRCYSMVLAGGGIKGGQVVGESDKIGGEPLNRPLPPADVHATIFSLLGYDPRQIFHTTDGRPMPLSEGTPIAEVM